MNIAREHSSFIITRTKTTYSNWSSKLTYLNSPGNPSRNTATRHFFVFLQFPISCVRMRKISLAPFALFATCNFLVLQLECHQPYVTHNIKPRPTIPSPNLPYHVCQTCSRYLMKNKVPPCYIANGMAFPVKPDFFDLNELECTLLAPRIAFQN